MSVLFIRRFFGQISLLTSCSDVEQGSQYKSPQTGVVEAHLVDAKNFADDLAEDNFDVPTDFLFEPHYMSTPPPSGIAMHSTRLDMDFCPNDCISFGTTNEQPVTQHNAPLQSGALQHI